MTENALVGGEPAEKLQRILRRFTIEQRGRNSYRIRGTLPPAELKLLSRALKTVESELASADPHQLGLDPVLVSPSYVETTAFAMLVVRVDDAPKPNIVH